MGLGGRTRLLNYASDAGGARRGPREATCTESGSREPPLHRPLSGGEGQECLLTLKSCEGLKLKER